IMPLQPIHESRLVMLSSRRILVVHAADEGREYEGSIPGFERDWFFLCLNLRFKDIESMPQRFISAVRKNNQWHVALFAAAKRSFSNLIAQVILPFRWFIEESVAIIGVL